VREYLATTNVQLGGTYPIGKIAQEKYDAGYKAAANFINAKPNEVGESKNRCIHGFDKFWTFHNG